MPNGNLGPDYQLAMRLSNIERQLLALATSPLLLNASTGQVPGQPGLSTDINGLHLHNAAGAEVATLSTVDGSATLGDTIVTGNLSVPNGSITNAALANPVQLQTSSAYINNYAISTTSTIRASLTLTVPNGFTQAVVIANPTGMGQNSTASTDYLYVQAVIQGTNGGELYTSCAAGLAVGIASPVHMTLTGLTGGQTITVGVATRAGIGAWAASTANQANIYATAIYLR